MEKKMEGGQPQSPSPGANIPGKSPGLLHIDPPEGVPPGDDEVSRPSTAGPAAAAVAEPEPHEEETSQMQKLIVMDHEVDFYNGYYSKAGDHAGWPRFERECITSGTTHMFYHARHRAWFLKSTFTPDDDGRKSWVDAPTGQLPIGCSTWLHGESSQATDGWREGPLTLTILATKTEPAPEPEQPARDPLEHTLAGETTRIFSASEKTPAAQYGGEETGWSKTLKLHPGGMYEWRHSSYSMDTYDYDRTTRVWTANGRWVETAEGTVTLDGIIGSRKDWDSFKEYNEGNPNFQRQGLQKQSPHHMEWQLSALLSAFELTVRRGQPWTARRCVYFVTVCQP
jgi:hypothetical protein